MTQRCERGTRLALLTDARGAQRAFDALPLTDARVETARKGVERVRQLLAKK